MGVGDEGSCSMDGATPKPLSSIGYEGLDCGSSMLSTRSNFLRGFGRGVRCAWVFCEGGACALCIEVCSSALKVRRCGVTRKRFAGVALTGWSS